MKKILFLLIFITNYAFLLAQNTDSVIVFDNESEILNIGRQVYLLEDKEGELTIEDIQKPQYQRLFKKSERKVPNFNTTQSKIWVKFVLSNQTDEKLYLEISQAMAWYIDFYKPDSTGKPVLTTETGMMRPLKNREVATNFFLFELSKSPTPQTYYFSIQSERTLTIPLIIATKEGIIEKNYPYSWFFGTFTGILLVMLFYNLFIYFSIKDTIYLFYCAYIIVSIFFINYISGNYGHQFNVISYFSNYLVIILFLNGGSIALFIIKLLQLQKKQFAYKILLFWVFFLFCCATFNLITGHYVQVFDFVQSSFLLISIYILAQGIYQYVKGHQTARFLVFGFSFYLMSIIVKVIQNFGIIPTNFMTDNAMIFGSSIEILLFSLALADRINNMRKEKDLAQTNLFQKIKEHEATLQNQNEILSQKVQEKTIDLQTKNEQIQVAYEEMSQMNEELQQTQEELTVQRDVLELKNHELEHQRLQIRKSIESAKLIQDSILPTETEMNDLFPQNFVLNKSKDVVSGDFYWISSTNHQKFIALADCTGHGVPGAFMTMIGVGLLDRIVEILKIYEPQEILETLNTEVQKILRQKTNTNTDGMDLALVRIDADKLVFSGAKRPIYLSEGTEIKKISGTRKSIGGHQNLKKKYEQTEIMRQHAVFLYLTSDGYTDQNDQERKNFSERRFMGMLSIIQEKTLSEQKHFLEDALVAHMAGSEQRDDILVVGVRV